MLSIDLSAEPRLSRIANIYSTVRTSVKIKDLQDEIDALHSSRVSRRLSAQAVTLGRIQSAITNDMQARARLVELRSVLSKNHALIEAAIVAGTNHVRAEYALVLKQSYATSQERQAAIDNLFEKYVKLRTAIASVIDDIDIKVKDIDQSSYHLRNLVDIAKMTLGHNGSGLEVA